MAIAEAPESGVAPEVVPGHDLLTGHATTVSPLRSVAKGALALVSTQPLTWAATLLSTIVVPRALGDTALGEYTLAYAFSSILGPVVTMGLLEYLSRRIAQRAEDAGRLATLALVLMTLAACGVAAVLAAAILVFGIQVGGPLVLVATLGLIVVNPAQGILMTVLRGQERMGRFAAVSGISAVAGALVPCGVLLAGGGVGGFALAGLVMNLASFTFSWRTSKIHLPRVRITAPALAALIPLGLPFLGWTVTQNFYNFIDRIMLGLLVPVEVVGWYAVANKIIAIPVFVPMLFVMPLFPALTRCRDDLVVFGRTLNASLRATILATAPFCAATLAAAPALPKFLGWPVEFDHASVPMMILAPNLAIVAVDMMLGTAVLALGMERKFLVVGLVAAAVNAGLNLFAIPFSQAMWGNGGIGAGATQVVTEFVILIGAFVLLPKGMVDRSLLSLVVRVTLAGAVFVGVTRLLLGMDLWLPFALVPGGLACLISTFPLGVIRVSDVKQARQLVRGVLDKRKG